MQVLIPEPTHKEAKTDLELEVIPLLNSQAVRFGNDGDNIDNFAEFLHHNNINRTEGVSRRVDEIEAAVDTCILDVTVPHGRQLLAEVRTMLVLDVLDDGVPAGKAPQTRNEKSFSSLVLREATYQFSLLTWSPYPGVSTMFNLSLTPFSTITVRKSCQYLFAYLCP